MTKRTFVLFFCLVHFLALSLSAKQPGQLCKLDYGTGFSPFSIETSVESKDVVIVDDTIDPNRTIVKADGCKWRENLSKLLRHRHSTYRFVSFETVVFSNYYFLRTPKLIREKLLTVNVSQQNIALPGYYGFLHRLCPF
ncbi:MULTISPECIES: hypothetical protein [Dyadobacter]|jgi:hypothetical protein|uniref:Uncharacterized protein n=1 Tax=Dyadobacter chenhuakuii TaxID=2909339 RepID=A0A9X1QE34_9BACT|nr:MULTISPECIES: hypothetical protein [Dyadobacter]MCE7069528.1 hypothetical protein [Dyadobacter sp. CY327]MCF2491854.1 hypothetical protein [Dyadobacter chenhuakuii]MCF2498792.1 hypothetical protein [Dyadobacter chenhuakuii]MCF2516493.1 hypothetical protein [Dyadobacter sp. CY351]USJ28982.1 hypothetical protein NFI80_13970 [Dyadobacter chenhuakuii]